MTFMALADVMRLAKVGHPHAGLLQLGGGHRQNDSDVVRVIETLVPKER